MTRSEVLFNKVYREAHLLVRIGSHLDSRGKLVIIGLPPQEKVYKRTYNAIQRHIESKELFLDDCEKWCEMDVDRSRTALEIARKTFDYYVNK